MNIKLIIDGSNTKNPALGEVGSGNVEVGKESTMQGIYIPDDCIRCCSKYLFGRGSEHYIGVTKRENLRDLLAFGRSSQHAYNIVAEYMSNLALFYQNDFILFHQECFKIQDSEDGIKILMLKGLKNGESYRMKLGMMFQSKFTEYLNNANFDNDLASQFIDNTIKTVSVVLKTNEANTLLDRVVFNLYDAISDDNSSWEKKVRALQIINNLAKHRCLNGKNEIIIEIVKQAAMLINHDQLKVVKCALSAICHCAEMGMEASPAVIAGILVKTEELLDHNDLDVVHLSIATIGALAIGDFSECAMDDW